MITLSEDQDIAFRTISKWLQTRSIVHPKQTDPDLLTLSGYAGTGKTFLTSTIIKEFDNRFRFAFCALSGKAASILGRKLRQQGIHFSEDGHFCGTIHSLIYTPVVNDAGEVTSWDQKEFIEYDVIVVDEASMISQDIFADLSSYGIRILAIGDHGQLPPIEGQFSLMQDPMLRLEKIHRQAEDNPIINLSMHIREHGTIPANYENNEHITIVSKKDCNDVLAQIFAPHHDPEALLDTAVICYQNATRAKFNTAIRQILYGNVDNTPLEDDVVVCLRNATKHRKQPLYNGFRGYFSGKVNVKGNHVSGKVEFPQDGVSAHLTYILKHQFNYKKTISSLAELDQFGMKAKSWAQIGLLFDYGYAMTCHKFQGSQADHIVLFNERPGPVSDDGYKRWLYSSVTRSSNKLTIIV